MNPEAFVIIDGKLYLNWDAESVANFKNEAAAAIPKADVNWDKLTSNPE